MRDEVKVEDADERDNDTLMSIILHFTRGEAGKVVRSFARKGDGVGAWRALASHYGNECKELRQARLIECSRLLEKVTCQGKEDIPAMVIELEHIFGEFEDLGCPYPNVLKKLTMLSKLQPAAGDI